MFNKVCYPKQITVLSNYLFWIPKLAQKVTYGGSFFNMSDELLQTFFWFSINFCFLKLIKKIWKKVLTFASNQYFIPKITYSVFNQNILSIHYPAQLDL